MTVCDAGRGGFALVVCMLLTLGLSMMVAGMLAVAAREARIAAAVQRLTTARVLAEGAARRAFADWSTSDLTDLAPGTERVVMDDGTSTVRVRPLAPRLFLLRADARVPAPAGFPARARSGLLAATLDMASLTAPPEAAVVVTGEAVVSGGSVSGRDVCGAAGSSGTPGADLPGLVAPVAELAPDAAVEGTPPTVAREVAPDPLADLAAERLAEITLDATAGSPAPVVRDGVCESHPWNWGTLAPDHPCHERRPLVHAPGDLRLRAGGGQGVLVVDGDLTLANGFVFHGAIIVRGHLRIDDATITGRLHAATLDLQRGTVRYSSCAIRNALAAPAFDRAFRPETRWWVPAF